MTTSALLALAAAVLAIGLLILASGLLLRERRDHQAEAALQAALLRRANQHGDEETPGFGQRLLNLLANFGQKLRGGKLGQALLASEDHMLLDQIGWNTLTGASAYLALRVLLAALVGIVLFAFKPSLLMLLIGLVIGIFLPKIALRSWGDSLRKQADNELPLLVDLLRLLQGVGLSMDQSLQMIGENLRAAIPLLGKELAAANVAYMHGRSREQSLQRLAEGYANDDLRSLVMLILQIHKHGGAVQEPLKQFSERLRERRRMELKEKIGKLSVKMTVVMMLTLLPALMLVLAGPAIVSLVRSLSNMGGS